MAWRAACCYRFAGRRGVDQIGLAVRIPTSRVNNLSCNIWNGVGGILASINQGLVCFSGCQFLRKPPVALSYRYGPSNFHKMLEGVLRPTDWRVLALGVA